MGKQNRAWHRESTQSVVVIIIIVRVQRRKGLGTKVFQ